jgi:hypothetical protein
VGRITLTVVGLDELLERLGAQRFEHEPIETIRTVSVPDPDGNAIAFVYGPDATSVTSTGRTGA